jgi:hypothetical protein
MRIRCWMWGLPMLLPGSAGSLPTRFAIAPRLTAMMSALPSSACRFVTAIRWIEEQADPRKTGLIETMLERGTLLLGFSLTEEKEIRVRVAPLSVDRFKDKPREKFRQ